MLYSTLKEELMKCNVLCFFSNQFRTFLNSLDFEIEKDSFAEESMLFSILSSNLALTNTIISNESFLIESFTGKINLLNISVTNC